MRALLWGGADAMAFNGAALLPLDVADPAAPAWATLEQELGWRTCLQVRWSPSNCRFLTRSPSRQRLLSWMRMRQ